MGYYRTCPWCGSNLDPAERCECRQEKKQKDNRFMALLGCDESGQIVMKVEDFKYAGN